MTANDYGGVTIGFNIGNSNTTYQYWPNLIGTAGANYTDGDCEILGLGWIRLNYSWRNIERTQGVYTWTVLDDAVANINASGLKLLFCIRGAPDWALTTSSMKTTSEPWYLPDPTLWANFVTAVLTRYNGGANGHIDAIGYNEDFNIHFTHSNDILTLNAQITHAGGPYTSLTIKAAQQTADVGTKIYLAGFNNTTDVATVSSAVAVGDLTVHINSFTPAVTYNAGVNMSVAYVGFNNSPYTIYNPGSVGVGVTYDSQPARDAHYAALVHNAMVPAVRAINPTMMIGMPCIWWTQPKNTANFGANAVSNYTGFYTQLYKDSKAHIDQYQFIDFHYYSNTVDPMVGAGGCSSITQAMTDLQNVMAANNDSTRAIWCTEFGWKVPADWSDAGQNTNYQNVLPVLIPSGNPNKNKFFFFTLGYDTSGNVSPLSLVYWNGSSYSQRLAYATVKNFLIANPSSSGGGTVTPHLTLSTQNLTFSGTVGGSNPGSQTVTVTNDTTGFITYTATSSASWLTVIPAVVTLSAGATNTSTVSVSLTGLASGTYVGTITYATGTFSTSLTVTLNLTASGSGGGGTSGGGLAPTPPYSVSIDGASYFVEAGTLLMDSAIGRRSTAYATIHTTDTATHFQQDQQVTITGANGVVAFTGYVSHTQESKPGFQQTLTHQLQFVDQHRLADKRIMAKAYTNKPASFIVQDIINSYLSAEGVTVGQIYDGPLPSTTLDPATTLYPNGSDSYIASGVFAYCTISQALDELVKITTTGGIPYYWMIDANQALWFVPYTAIVNSTVIDGTLIDDGTASGLVPIVSRNNPTYRNAQYILGGVQTTVPQVQSFIGDGTTTSWPLGFEVNTLSAIYLNGSLQTVGVKGVDSGKNFYYAVGDATIVQDPSGSVLQGTAQGKSPPDTLTVYYTGQYPSVFYSKDNAQVTLEAGLDGTSGIVEEAETDSTIVSASAGLARTANLLQRYATQGTQFKFNTKESGYQAGQMVTVNYAPLGFSSTQMLIEQATASDQRDSINFWNTLYCIAGPYDTTWVSFFSNLIQQSKAAGASINVGLSSGLVQLAQFTTSITVSGTMTVSVFQAVFPNTTLFPSTTLYPVQ